MTQEDKNILLKDLCARLPYGVEASVRGSDEECISFEVLGIKEDLIWVRNKMLLVDHFETIEVIKPYLRPMSSMTEDEKKEIYKFYHTDGHGFPDAIDELMVSNYVDYCNAHHFDYRGLIPMGLALPAKEGMYKEKRILKLKENNITIEEKVTLNHEIPDHIMMPYRIPECKLPVVFETLTGKEKRRKRRELERQKKKKRK